MTEDRISPEEFARLLSLPEDHPDRLHAAATPEFESMNRMLSEFEQPRVALQSAGDATNASADLRRRLGDFTGARHVDRFARFRRPAGRVAFAFASLMFVVALAWWSQSTNDRSHVVRGSVEGAEFSITAIHGGTGSSTLEWSAAPGADEYRIIFLGPDLGEIARLENLHDTRYVLRAAALPHGLIARAIVSVEIIAVRHGDPIAATSARSLMVP